MPDDDHSTRSLPPGPIGASEDASATLLTVRELSVYYPAPGGAFSDRGFLACRGRLPLCAVDGVSLEIRRGETLALVGESGCGKTSLGRAILRLVPSSSGQIMFNGADWLALRGAELRRIRRRVQMVFQDPAAGLNPRMTVKQLVQEPLIIHRLTPRSELTGRAAGLLEQVGLPASLLSSRPYELSGGQRQRVAIARAMATRPDLLVCDEPVSALDLSVRGQILNLLSDLQRTLGMSYLFIAHNLTVVSGIADRVAVMYCGRLVETGPTDQVFATPRHPYTAALLASVPNGGLGRKASPARWLAGEPPSLIDRPGGCALHPRCPLATPRCARETPVREAKDGLAAGREVACHYWQEVSSVDRCGGAPAAGF